MSVRINNVLEYQGAAVPVFSLAPSWRASPGFSARAEAETVVSESLSGAEYRAQRRPRPFWRLRYEAISHDARESGYARRVVQLGADLPVAVPYWPHRVELTAAASAEATSVSHEDTGDTIWPDARYALIWEDALNWEVVELDGEAGATVTDLAEALEESWPAGAALVPLLVGHIERGAGATHETDELGVWMVDFRESPVEALGVTTAIPSIPGWLYRRRITSDSDLVIESYSWGAALDLAQMPADFFGKINSDGGDIRITMADGITEVARGVVEIDTAANRGVVYFRAVALSALQDTDYFLYYGNAAASDYPNSHALGMHNVWSAEHALYCPLGDGPSSDVLDATPHGNHGTKQDGVQSSTGGDGPDEVDAVVGKGQDFVRVNDSEGDRTDHGSASILSLAVNDRWTMGCWMYARDVAASSVNQIVMGKGSNQTNRDDVVIIVESNSGGRVSSFVRDAASSDSMTVSAPLGAAEIEDKWLHVVAVRRPASYEIYINGDLVSANTGTLITNGDQGRFSIGCGLNRGFGGSDSRIFPFDGMVDEAFALANKDLSANAIKTIYNMQVDNAAFWAVGEEAEL